jgi:hypothetical protein
MHWCVQVVVFSAGQQFIWQNKPSLADGDAMGSIECKGSVELETAFTLFNNS